MFTGIITHTGIITVADGREGVRRLEITTDMPLETLALGASVAHSGVCLTVVDRQAHGYAVEVGAETLACTTASAWQQGTRLNLERALKMGDELGGHLVTGHVDGMATLVERRDLSGMAEFILSAPETLSRLIAKKGSVTLDGASLTVNAVEGNRFSVLLIPHTLKATTLGDRHEGDPLNLEVDMMARYVARLLERQETIQLQK